MKKLLKFIALKWELYRVRQAQFVALRDKQDEKFFWLYAREAEIRAEVEMLWIG